MKWIHLTGEFYACVDDEDYEEVSKYLWRNHRGGYGRCDELNDLTLHEFLMGRKDGFQVDHINRGPWDNRRCNLRLIPVWQNVKNTGTPDNPPFPSAEDKETSKRQRHDLKYGEKYTKRRAWSKPGNKNKRPNNHLKKAVIDDLGNTFESVASAALFYNIKSPNLISICCRDSSKKTHGRTWKYYSE